MTDALIAALPTGATVEPEPFAPTFGFDAGAVRQSLDGQADALGTVTVGNRTGTLTVTVGLSDQPAGPCFAGFVDQRSTQSDGTVLDIQDSTHTTSRRCERARRHPNRRERQGCTDARASHRYRSGTRTSRKYTCLTNWVLPRAAAVRSLPSLTGGIPRMTPDGEQSRPRASSGLS